MLLTWGGATALRKGKARFRITQYLKNALVLSAPYLLTRYRALP